MYGAIFYDHTKHEVVWDMIIAEWAKDIDRKVQKEAKICTMTHMRDRRMTDAEFKVYLRERMESYASKIIGECNVHPRIWVTLTWANGSNGAARLKITAGLKRYWV